MSEMVKRKSRTPGVSKLRRRPRPIGGALKAERVQELLKAMPGWRLVEGGRAIHSIRELPSARAAAAFAAYVALYAGCRRQAARLMIAGRQVSLTLPGMARPRGTFAGLTHAVLAMARSLG